MKKPIGLLLGYILSGHPGICLQYGKNKQVWYPAIAEYTRVYK